MNLVPAKAFVVNVLPIIEEATNYPPAISLKMLKGPITVPLESFLRIKGFRV
jgi:hypothetical protein